MTLTPTVHNITQRNSTLNALVIAILCGNIISAVIFVYFIQLANWQRTLALQGDESAAVRILLPCYRPIFRLMVVVYLLTALGLGLTFIRSEQSPADQFYILQFASLIMLTVFSVVPILLLQRSVSYKAFRATACYIIPWFLISAGFWLLSSKFSENDLAMISFWVLSGLPALIVSICMRCEWISSRVHMASRSARSSVEYLLVYAIFYCTVNIFSVKPIQAYTRDEHLGLDIFLEDEKTLVTIACIFASFSILWNQLFPWVMYATLLADTRFWRGVGKFNSQGFQIKGQDESEKKRGKMDIRLVTHDLQGVMREIGDIAVDFAFLDIHTQIGKGAHASVYKGKLKKENVAIKLFTPEEVNQEVIQEFVREAKLSMPLLHPNIVNFMGICVRPPEIAMIMELCDGGDLKSNLVKNEKHWTFCMRAQACLDGAHAVNYFHSMGYIHRDIKAENFFITGDVCAIDHELEKNLLTPPILDSNRDTLRAGDRKGDPLRETTTSVSMFSAGSERPNASSKGFTVKLGDFGESTKQRLKSDGTVEVLNEKLYNTQARGQAGRLDDDRAADIVDEESVAGARMSIKGTVGYLAPEMVKAEKAYSEKIDIYSLGVTFVEIWTGQDPWKGLPVFKIYTAVETGQRPDLPANMPEQFKEIVRSCWNQDASKRPTADMLTRMLEKFILDTYNLDMRLQKQAMTARVRGSLVGDQGDSTIFPSFSKVIKTVSRKLSIHNSGGERVRGVSTGLNLNPIHSDGRSSEATSVSTSPSFLSDKSDVPGIDISELERGSTSVSSEADSSSSPTRSPAAR